MLEIEISEVAKKDIAKVLRYSENEFGSNARKRYKKLINQAIYDLAENPKQIGVRNIDDIRKGYFIYHLGMSRKCVSGEKVGNPRHFILFKLLNSDRLFVARLLHERMLLVKHV